MLAVAQHSLGSGYVLKGMDAQARLAFMRALELDPNFVDAMHNLSIFHFATYCPKNLTLIRRPLSTN